MVVALIILDHKTHCYRCTEFFLNAVDSVESLILIKIPAPFITFSVDNF